MSELNFVPIDDRVVIKPEEGVNKTESGLYIPDTSVQRPLRGEVVAIGPGRQNSEGERLKMQLAIGDKVLYPKHGFTAVTFEDQEYLIIKEGDVLSKY